LPGISSDDTVIEAVDKVEIKDTLIVFVKDELVFFRFNKNTGWNVGDASF